MICFISFPSLAQTTSAVNASTLFYLTLLFIFLTAIITAVVTKWSKDKCLGFFNRYHVTLEQTRGHTIWGHLKVFSSGIEVMYDHAFVDTQGRKKTSYMVYQAETDQQVLGLFRYHDELSEANQKRRLKQVHRTFNPGPIRRLWRAVRNFINTLRDAFNAAIGAAVGQYQKLNPTSAVLSSQGGSVTAIGQTLLGKLANAYEPMLEQYIGRAVILDVLDPLDPNNRTVEYSGYLAEYTQRFISLFNVEHETAEEVVITLPDVESGAALPAVPAPPPPGGAPVVLPEAICTEHGIAVRIDGTRFKVQNLGNDPVIIRKLEREGFEPLKFGTTIPARGTMDLPARDARGAKLTVERVRCLDVIAPRKFATIRHAGEMVDRRGIVDELRLRQLPLVPRLFSMVSDRESEEAPREDATGATADDD